MRRVENGNQLQSLGVAQAIGSKPQAEIIPAEAGIQCESFDSLTDKEKEMVKEFPL